MVPTGEGVGVMQVFFIKANGIVKHIIINL
jgi:hypothetical protein